MKKIKFQNMFLIAPFLLTILMWYYTYSNNGFGLNIFGTCSIRKAKNSGKMFLLVAFTYLSIVIITITTLKKYKKLSENRITIRDDFLNFYLQYSILTFCMYIFSGLSFLFDKLILEDLDLSSDENKIKYLQWFYISRLTNNVKIFIPLFTFLL
jgi:hypothetical protein